MSPPWPSSVPTAAGRCHTHSHYTAPSGLGYTGVFIGPNTVTYFSQRNKASQLRKHYQVMGELLNELQGPEEQCGPADTLLRVLSAVSTEDALLLRFCSRRSEVPTDAQALNSQALC